MRREFGFALPAPNCDLPVDTIDSAPTGAAGSVALEAWVKSGRVPASLPRIAVSGTPLEVERDAFGNALEGIRIPPIAVATATHGAPNGLRANLRCFLLGYELPFSDADLRALYAGSVDYATRVRRAADEAQSLGFLLPEDAEQYRRAANDGRIASIVGCRDRVPGGARRAAGLQRPSFCPPPSRRTLLPRALRIPAT